MPVQFISDLLAPIYVQSHIDSSTRYIYNLLTTYQRRYVHTLLYRLNGPKYEQLNIIQWRHNMYSLLFI